jgi:hypothetical protein
VLVHRGPVDKETADKETERWAAAPTRVPGKAAAAAAEPWRRRTGSPESWVESGGAFACGWVSAILEPKDIFLISKGLADLWSFRSVAENHQDCLEWTNDAWNKATKKN